MFRKLTRTFQNPTNRGTLWQTDSNRFSAWWSADSGRPWPPWKRWPETRTSCAWGAAVRRVWWGSFGRPSDERGGYAADTGALSWARPEERNKENNVIFIFLFIRNTIKKQSKIFEEIGALFTDTTTHQRGGDSAFVCRHFWSRGETMLCCKGWLRRAPNGRRVKRTYKNSTLLCIYVCGE